MVYDAQELETANCPVCGSDRRHPIGHGRDGLGVVRCGRCGVLFLSPRLRIERMMQHYRDASYFEGSGCGYASYSEQERSLRLTFAALLRRLERVGSNGGSLLEVGCGHGFFLDEARSFFEHRVGTDMSAQAAAVASRHADAVFTGGVDAVPLEMRFDLVVALHVIEHVYEPGTFIRDVAARVKPGGYLLLATPDAGSFWFRLLGRRWPSYKFPEHVVFYDRRSLTKLLQAVGLFDVRSIAYPHAFPVNEVLRKVGIHTSKLMAKWTAWIPATTLAILGRTGADAPAGVISPGEG
jgi:2-polyprenyl-3-methyl-5-hydroxy-6-metoxy-1,4-benzoquinol methylase